MGIVASSIGRWRHSSQLAKSEIVSGGSGKGTRGLRGGDQREECHHRVEQTTGHVPLQHHSGDRPRSRPRAFASALITGPGGVLPPATYPEASGRDSGIRRFETSGWLAAPAHPSNLARGTVLRGSLRPAWNDLEGPASE